MRKPYERKIKAGELIAFANKVKYLTFEENPEITFEYLINSLFPGYLEEMEQSLNFKPDLVCEDEDVDCYCE